MAAAARAPTAARRTRLAPTGRAVGDEDQLGGGGGAADGDLARDEEEHGARPERGRERRGDEGGDRDDRGQRQGDEGERVAPGARKGGRVARGRAHHRLVPAEAGDVGRDGGDGVDRRERPEDGGPEGTGGQREDEELEAGRRRRRPDGDRDAAEVGGARDAVGRPVGQHPGPGHRLRPPSRPG